MSDDLDFTQLPPAGGQPSAQKVAEAQREASAGGSQLAKTGFYVAMARHAAGRLAPRNGERHDIFVIEDDASIAGLVGEVLANGGFLTRFARNKSEINEQFNRPPLPDLVLLDVTLPDADGFQILERIRGNPRIAKVPVVMMTGRSEVADIARGLALGADGYVTKPFQVSGLLAAVKTALGLE